jgi:uncharacterized membrane protein YdjX (TVP38/TMEM64 family)
MPVPGEFAPASSTAAAIGRWSVFVLLLLSFVLIPFFLFEGRINALVQSTLASATSVLLITAAVVGFLVADVVLPVPSSFVLTTTGYLLGAGSGTAVCFVGMTCASLAGYWLGRYAANAVAKRIVGAAQLDRFGAVWQRYGDTVLVAFRAVPVLAEATTILAGISGVRVPRFLFLVSIGNIVVSLVYASIGAASASQSSFLLASIASVVLPVLIVLITRRATRP